MVANAMENDPEFLCVAKGMLWYQRHRSPSGFGTLGAECAFGNGPKEVDVTSEHLRQIAAALRAASSPPPGGAEDQLGAARRRTDDNLRRAFGCGGGGR